MRKKEQIVCRAGYHINFRILHAKYNELNPKNHKKRIKPVMESELEFGNMDLRMDYRKKPVRNTVAQQLMATINRSPLTQATMRPTARAAAPDQTLSVTVTIAGKVMTARVT